MSTDKEIKHLEKIEKQLGNLRVFYQKILSIYAIKDDLINVEVNKDSALKDILDSHIQKNQEKIDELLKTLNTEVLKIEAIETSILEIKKFNDFMLGTTNDGTTIPRHKKLEVILSDDNIADLKIKSDELNQQYNLLFVNKDSQKKTKVEELKNFINELESFHNFYFVGDSKEPSRYDEIQDIFDDIVEKHQIISSGYEKKGADGKIIKYKSYFQDIVDKRVIFDKTLNELEEFYLKIFGDEDNQKDGLSKELDIRLTKLKEVEEEAKKVIALSSDAGLAGGFLQKGEQARKNKYISLTVFVIALVIMGLCNFLTIDFDKLKEIDLVSLAVRLVINAPFIWVATVANISLNKYARLEEEYAHKESLAKSFERYKSEIEKIDDTESIKSKDLLAQLMKTNLQAFELNPAETMDKAKSDIPSSLITSSTKDKKEN